MNIVKLNTISLDGDTFIKKGGSSTAKPKYTGHADVEGLKAIGWDDEDIAYYQQYGVNWNEEEDMYHKVSDANKALYGVLNADNISTYKDVIVYLPKIPVPKNMKEIFKGCKRLIALPKLDTSNVTNMNSTFKDCHSLTFIPPLDTSNVYEMIDMFYNCYSLTFIPTLDTSKLAANMNGTFCNCYSLTSIPPLDTSKLYTLYETFMHCHSLTFIPPLDTSTVMNMNRIIEYCYSLVSIPQLDMSMVNSTTGMFDECYNLANIKLKNIKVSISFAHNLLLHKDSVLYMINNEAAKSPITLTLHSAVYDTLINDEEIVAALEAHPNVSLAK